MSDGRPLPIGGVLETCLYTSELAATAAFYREVLGLAEESAVDGRHVFFRCGAGMLLLFDPARTREASNGVPPHGTHGAGHIAFSVADAQLEQWRNWLAEAGGEVEAEVSWPGGGRSLYLRDPGGNSVEPTSPRIWKMDESVPGSAGP